jgi:hypothetical protein
MKCQMMNKLSKDVCFILFFNLSFHIYIFSVYPLYFNNIIHNIDCVDIPEERTPEEVAPNGKTTNVANVKIEYAYDTVTT